MKKLIALLLVFVMVAALFVGCDKKKKEKEDSCDHEWESGTCTTPRTCKECGKTMGKEKGHKWAAANCEDPKSCTRCDATDGEPLGHTWKEATCIDPQVCTVCEKIGDAALGHDMKEATLDAPSTCSRCDHTEGYSLGQTIDKLEVTDYSSENIQLGSWKDVHGNTHDDTLCFQMKDKTSYSSQEEITFNLNGEYRLLKGTIVLSEESDELGSGYFAIYADGWRVYSSMTVTNVSKAIEFEVDLEDVESLTILCNSYVKADTCLLLDARVHK